MLHSPNRRRLVATLSATVALLLAASSAAQVCPFDSGGSSLENDGLVLTRYALGLRGAPMVANTSFAATDAATIESNIACPSCGLRVTDDKDALNNPIFTVADATIISRKIAGFSGPALTNGLVLGNGTRNNATAVQSFLLAGCGATGGTVTSVRGGAGIVATGPNVVGGAIVSSGLIELANGFILPQGCTPGQVPKSAGGGAWSCAADNVGTTVTNAFTQGGNGFGVPAVLGTTDGQPLTVGTGSGDGLRITRSTNPDPDGMGLLTGVHVVNGSRDNAILNNLVAVTIAGGGYFVDDGSSTPLVYANRVYATGGTVGGGAGNDADGSFSTVAGGFKNNAAGRNGVVSGGYVNRASGNYSAVPGGSGNAAKGDVSFAAGNQATASDTGEFVWNGSATAWNPKALNAWGGNTSYTFNVRVDRGVYFQSGSTQCTFGAGTSGWNCASDRALKEKIIAVSPRAVLEKVASLPVSTWVIKGYEQLHMGPMAQDFRAAFGLGSGDKMINTTDAQGVALAAIQGLNLKLNAQIKTKDAEIAKLKAKYDADIAAIKKKLGM